MSNDSDIATPCTSMKHLIATAQAKWEQVLQNSDYVLNDFDISTPSTSMKYLIEVAQAKWEQARFAALPHSVSIEETENSIPFISNPSPIRGSSSDHSSPLQLHLDGEETEDTKDAISHT